MRALRRTASFPEILYVHEHVVAFQVPTEACRAHVESFDEDVEACGCQERIVNAVSRDRPARVTAADRRVRIELLRMRASYERLAVQRSACRLAGELQPESLMARVRDRLGAAGLGWLGGGLQTLRRYPMLLSVVASMVSTRRRRGLALKTALIASLVWLVRDRS